MPRRRRGGVVDPASHDDSNSDGVIEIIDLDASLSASEAEVVTSEPPSTPSTLAVAAGIIVAAIALFGVVTAGNTPAPAPPAPSVTVPTDPISAEEAALAAEVAELEATYGVEIGDGPDLTWHRVVFNIDADEFQWIDDGFVGQNEQSEWTIRPTNLGASISQVDNLALQYPGYVVQLVEGARLLVPENAAADHLLVVLNGREPIRFELPPPAIVPSSDLVRPVRQWSDGLVLDETMVLAGIQRFEVDLETLGRRAGRDLSAFDSVAIVGDELRPRLRTGEQDPAVEPIAFEDIGLTEEELVDLALPPAVASEALSLHLISAGVETINLDDLAWVNSVDRTTNGAGLLWSDINAQRWLSTSSDGLIWSTRPLAADNGDVWFSGPRLYTMPVGGPSSIRRSGDLGSTWQRTRRPFLTNDNNLAIDDILIVTEGTQALVSDEPARIVTDDYVVTITGAGRSFELSDPETGEIVVSGLLDDSAAGLAFDAFGPGLAIEDPESGDELLSLPQAALLRAYAEANNRPPSSVAITRWDPADADPEWSIQPVDAMFSNGVEVHFTAGDGHILAMVSTTQGVDYYVASTNR